VTPDPTAALPLKDTSEDLLVTSLSVQGGEALIGSEKSAFARILLSGLRLENTTLSEDRRPARQVAVLKLDVAHELLVGLREIMNSWARSTPTPVVPARGVWSWMSGPLPGDDILVTHVKTGGEQIRKGDQVTPIIRLDFMGTPLEHSSLDVAPSPMPGAVFSVPRHVQALISSLKKCILALRPQTELQYLGFAMTALDGSEPDLESFWSQPQS
jgi:hypothetical protein